MWNFVATSVLLMVFAAVCPPSAIAWDDFKGKKLDGIRWIGDQFGSPGAIGLELRREISGGKLLMSHRALGEGGGVSTNRVLFRNSVPFTSIQYDVKVNAVSATACAGSVANISQYNLLFTSDNVPGCSTALCDVFAIFYIDHVAADGANMVQVHGRVIARGSDLAEVLLGSAEFTPIIGLLKKPTLNVKVGWNELAHTVTFDVTFKKATTSIPVDYGAGLTNLGGGPLNSIEVSEFVCDGGVTESSSSWDNIVVTP